MTSSRLAIDSRWKHYACATVLVAGVLISLLRWVLFTLSDPWHCNALITAGQWIGPKNWQPEGCMLHSYSSKDAVTCFRTRRLVFVGDSITRNFYFTFMNLADQSLPATVPDNQDKHVDYHYTSSTGSEFAFLWDPFLNTSQTWDLIQAKARPEPKPFLLVLGSGLWYLRNWDSSGGLEAWGATMKRILERIPRHDVASNVVLLPVEKLVTSKLSEERAVSMKSADIDAMNSDLKNRLYLAPSLPNTFGVPAQFKTQSPIIFPMVFNDVLLPSETTDGLHYAKEVVSMQANILYNRLCNNALPKSFPLDKTCCRAYPRPSLIQTVILTLLTCAGPSTLLFRRYAILPNKAVKLLPNPQAALHLTVVGGAVGLLFLADRTHVFLKEQKQFDPVSFSAFVVFAIAIGTYTLKNSGKEQPFLNRNQTDEWKGWMQLIILIYHYFGASKISGIYNPIRVLVASYLFMTGYGHCSFYLKKADYGFLRIAQVLTRLNLLTLLLAYAMDTNYFDYYFAPMVSFWFLVIYVTMVCGARFNDRSWFIFSKIVLSHVVVNTFINTPIIFETFFSFLATYGKISWPPSEVKFRLNLDIWIVYIGMVCALLYGKCREIRISDQPYWRKLKGLAAAISCLSLVWYMYFQLNQPSKFTYNKWHPYISWIPILAFVVLRNATATLRSSSSTTFAFIGTCSLETFIIQFHFWLAADTKGVLLMLPGTKLRPLNLVFTTTAFIWLSHRVAISTVHLTDWICGISKEPSLPHVQQTSTSAGTEMESLRTSVTQTSARPQPGSWADRLAAPHHDLPTIYKWGGDLRLRLLLIGLILWVMNSLWSS